MSDEPAVIDLDRVRREIDDEVRARRAAGDFPAGMERELDLAFARVSPVASTGNDLRGLLEAADRAAFIDAQPATASRKAVLAVVKKTERKLLGWYFNHLAQQVTAFAGATVRALQVLADRVERVERALPREGADAIGRAEPVDLGAGLAAKVVGALAGVEGRVLVSGEDRGLLEALAGGGVEGYGVAPTAVAHPRAAVERRDGDPLGHLLNLAPASLGGVVLLGIDAATTATKLALVDAATAALVDGGRVVVLSGRLDRWGIDNPVESDLAPGRPFRPETWTAVLQASGYVDLAVIDGAELLLVTAGLKR